MGNWVAYVLTRPLGASLGDLLSQQKDAGGLGLGTTATSFLFLAAICVLVGYLTDCWALRCAGIPPPTTDRPHSALS